MGGWKGNRREKEREWEGGRITGGKKCKKMPVLDKKYKSTKYQSITTTKV